MLLPNALLDKAKNTSWSFECGTCEQLSTTGIGIIIDDSVIWKINDGSGYCALKSDIDVTE